jgi:hypothetical protein
MFFPDTLSLTATKLLYLDFQARILVPPARKKLPKVCRLRQLLICLTDIRLGFVSRTYGDLDDNDNDSQDLTPPPSAQPRWPLLVRLSKTSPHRHVPSTPTHDTLDTFTPMLDTDREIHGMGEEMSDKKIDDSEETSEESDEETDEEINEEASNENETDEVRDTYYFKSNVCIDYKLYVLLTTRFLDAAQSYLSPTHTCQEAKPPQ